MSPPVTSTGKTVTITREEYEALTHTAKVTAEYLSGKAKSFDSIETLISHLKKAE